MLPIILNLKHCTCLVVGCGVVGQRRVRMLLDAGAEVRVVCPQPPIRFEGERQPTWTETHYRPDHLDDIGLVFAAAEHTVNLQVALDARMRGLLVNLADRPDLSDFHVPAIHRRGPLLVSVSTGGATPGLARAIRERLADDLDDAVVQWIQLVAELRPLILERATPQDATGLLARLADWRWVERIRADGVEAVGRAMGDELKPLD